jgi:hypothetical protein
MHLTESFRGSASAEDRRMLLEVGAVLWAAAFGLFGAVCGYRCIITRHQHGPMCHNGIGNFACVHVYIGACR